MPTEVEQVHGHDVCCMMHTSLRKCCDSKVTTAAYSLIHLICTSQLPEKFDPWRMYGNIVARYMNEGHSPRSAAKQAVKYLESTWCVASKKAEENNEYVPTHCQTAMYALSGILACFSDQDWYGFVEYLKP